MTNSILIIGGSGFVGNHLALRLREGYKIFSTYHSRSTPIPGVTNVPLDVSNRSLMRKILVMAKPEVIIYLAGSLFSNSPSWEFGKGALSRGRNDSQQLDKIHTEGPANLVNLAELGHPRFIYLSSALVFDGTRGNYHDNDPAIPQNSLGRAQISGENFIRSRMAQYIIIRSSKLFGRANPTHPSLLDRIRMNLDRGNHTELNDFHYHSFAPITGLVDLISELISKPSIRGKIYHYGGLTKVTLAGFARDFATRYRYDPKLIIPKSPAATSGPSSKTNAADFGMDKILDFSLNSSATVEALKIKPLLLEEGFDLIEKQLIASL